MWMFPEACTRCGAGGDLWRILDKDRDRTVFGWYRRGKQVALDVASGLHYLHSHRIVHFDLKVREGGSG